MNHGHLWNGVTYALTMVYNSMPLMIVSTPYYYIVPLHQVVGIFRYSLQVSAKLHLRWQSYPCRGSEFFFNFYLLVLWY